MDQAFLRKVYKKLPPNMKEKAKKMANKYLDVSLTETGDVSVTKLLGNMKNGRTSVKTPGPVEITDPSVKTVSVVGKKDCSGCGACFNSCPVKAIEMQPDHEGYLYPVIDEEKCINCGKCQKSCPAIQVKYDNHEPVCYAVMADDEVRGQSSSGGMFTLLADYVLEKGGAVCGAAYADDMSVEHIMIDRKEDLGKLRFSKYVQSNTKHIYQETEKVLKSGRPVLFSGCPCQVAAVKAYLGKDYDQLYTADLICHGVPSQKVFRKYLDDCYPDKKVTGVNFRNKASFGWSSNMSVYFEDGTCHLERAVTDPYFRAFQRVLDTRPSCGECRFATFPRQGDISIGDFWGISKVNPEMTDNKGTSLVLSNSEKGDRVFEELHEKMKKMEKYPVEEATSKSGSIDHQIKQHPDRERFFRLLDIYPFDKAVEYTLKKKYDIGVIGLWYGRNYGSMATYYALHHTLASMGLSVLMINNPLGRNDEVLTKTNPRRFANEYYDISKIYPMGSLRKLNEVCDGFIVGSDQLWNFGLSRRYGQYYFLSFADNNKKKIAYGTSFGKASYSGTEGYRAMSAEYLQQFDAVSVREGFAIDMCKEIYGVDATWVTDPVFFCKDTDYAEIEKERPECKDEDYILAYILDPYKEKTEAILHVAEKLNKKVKVILDEIPARFEDNKKAMGIPEGAPVEILREVDLKEWLYCFHHSSYVLTDSFHGTCFAIIFKKNFTAMTNPKRGSQRFASLLDRFGLGSRLTPDAVSVINHPMLDQDIDYEKTFRIIDQCAGESRKWLENAVFSPKKVKSYTAYQIEDQREGQ